MNDDRIFATRLKTVRGDIDARSRKYRQAAIGYFVYGAIYLAGAIHLSGIGEGPAAGWIWFAVGAAMAVGFPILIWMEFKWVTRILALLVTVRVIGLLRIVSTGGEETVSLPWGGEIRMLHGAIVFLLIAAAECYLLIRAGWGIGSPGTAPNTHG